MLKKIGIVVLVLVLGLVTLIATRPAAFAIERKAVIAATPSILFANVNDFHKWEAWSPWAKLDPSMKTEYSGAAAGVGAVYTWHGDDKVGDGRMTISESKPAERIGIKLDFLKPMEMNNLCDFTFAPSGSGAEVSWVMKGTNGFLGKAFALFMDTDKMVGGDFERGLASLKTVAEADQAKAMAAKLAADAAQAKADADAKALADKAAADAAAATLAEAAKKHK